MLLRVLLPVCILLGRGVCTVQAGTIYDSPYVTFSPNGRAWTSDAGNRDIVWYEEGGADDVVTGVPQTLRALQAGEHYYAVKRTGSIPVGRWQVRLSKVNCCHQGYPDGNTYEGVAFARQICLKPHFSAWQPICADCGQPIAYNHFYMSKEAVRSLTYLEMHPNLHYYYLCPFSDNLEQGVETGWHWCSAISANRYRVVYLPNANGEKYAGVMAESYHFYDNATQYEGRAVTPQTHLSKNTYARVGWRFAGWNTAPDGSGESYADEAEILNLCAEDYQPGEDSGTVYLYAMWERARASLQIRPEGGAYEGVTGIYVVDGGYGEDYTVDPQKLSPPAGKTVSFCTSGGEPLADIRGTQHFTEWRQVGSFAGKLSGNRYTFLVPDGNVDTVSAVYAPDPILLPLPVKENSSFGGWYYDEDFLRPAGRAGDAFTPTEDVTLYAQWVELVLRAEENYEPYKGRGAVDLSWSQTDGRRKAYILYQSDDAESWEQVYDASYVGTDEAYTEDFVYDGFAHPFLVPYSGFYKLTVQGAQGGDYGEYAGGAGGRISGSFWLDRDDMLYCCSGGSNGFNGGGQSTAYASGGGYSVIESQNLGVLLIAGGGGGAGPNGDGHAGGSQMSVLEDGMIGESGASGGGGGYRGGHAGELILHTHEEGVCNHVHEGDPSENGGCYTTKVICNETLQHKSDGSVHWYWAGTDEIYCPACGADATKGETCTGHDTNYYKHVCPVHGNQKRNTSSKSPSKCSVVVSYAPSCGMTEDYTCGYEEGDVVSAKPAYGGSNYVNPDWARSYVTEAGAQYGDGEIHIESEEIGFWEDNSLEAVRAPDYKAPDAIDAGSAQWLAAGDNVVQVCWETPADHGNTYYHMAQSYSADDGSLISVSNITENTIVTGVAGYYYYVDTKTNTNCNIQWFSNTKNNWVKVTLADKPLYLHVAPVDKAGNVGKTTHLPVGSTSSQPGQIRWPVYTQQMQIADSDAVWYAAPEQTYYVRCDGKAPFVLTNTSYMLGTPTPSYQLNYSIIESVRQDGRVSQNRTFVPSGAISNSSVVLQGTALDYTVQGEESVLQNGSYTLAERENRGRTLRLQQEFLLNPAAHGEWIELLPIAGADTVDGVLYSDHTLDAQNGLTLIGDGEAPVIYGFDELQTLQLIDRREVQLTLDLTAYDALSGVGEFYLEIDNLDNGDYRKLLPDDAGHIRIDLTADAPLFSGDFSVRAYAVDHVGNERTLTCATMEFDLQAILVHAPDAQEMEPRDVRTIMPEEERSFKRGESACLFLSSWGYADRVEVEFPAELAALDPDLNHTYVYDMDPSYRHDEALLFEIPLYAPPNGSYEITVRAYKKDKMLERHPAFAVLDVTGSVLDEVHTRLR